VLGEEVDRVGKDVADQCCIIDRQCCHTGKGDCSGTRRPDRCEVEGSLLDCCATRVGVADMAERQFSIERLPALVAKGWPLVLSSFNKEPGVAHRNLCADCRERGEIPRWPYARYASTRKAP
jgi:hypothetical protein